MNECRSGEQLFDGGATLGRGAGAARSSVDHASCIADEDPAVRVKPPGKAGQRIENSANTIPLAGADDAGPDDAGPDVQLITWARHAAVATNGIICAVARHWLGRRDLPSADEID